MPHGYKLIGVRQNNSKVQLGTASNLDDAQAEAAIYLEDPRDTIQAVYFWDVREEQFHGWASRPQQTYNPIRRRRTDALA